MDVLGRTGAAIWFVLPSPHTLSHSLNRPLPPPPPPTIPCRWMLGNEIDDVLDLTFAEETDYFGAPVCPV